jgi:hypothetical protein
MKEAKEVSASFQRRGVGEEEKVVSNYSRAERNVPQSPSQTLPTRSFRARSNGHARRPTARYRPHRPVSSISSHSRRGKTHTREKPLVADIYPVFVCYAVWTSEGRGMDSGYEAVREGDYDGRWDGGGTTGEVDGGRGEVARHPERRWTGKRSSEREEGRRAGEAGEVERGGVEFVLNKTSSESSTDGHDDRRGLDNELDSSPLRNARKKLLLVLIAQLDDLLPPLSLRHLFQQRSLIHRLLPSLPLLRRGNSRLVLLRRGLSGGFFFLRALRLFGRGDVP